MFQFGRLAHPIRVSLGLPHSEILGSTLFCSSPKLIAALHVLHRLLMPRHPPCALTILLLRACTTRPKPPFLLRILLLIHHYVKKTSPTNTVELAGVEPATSCLQGRRSSQLSYSPGWKVGLEGVEPSTSRLSGVRSNHLSYKPRLPSKEPDGS